MLSSMADCAEWLVAKCAHMGEGRQWLQLLVATCHLDVMLPISSAQSAGRLTTTISSPLHLFDGKYIKNFSWSETANG